MGLSVTNGSWVMFIDPDDAVNPDIIESLLKAAHDDIDIICCCCQVLLDQETVEDHFYKGDRLFSTFEDKQDLWGQLLDYKYKHPNFDYAAIAVPWAKLYRASMLKDNDIQFDKTLVRMQDNVFNTYAFYYARKIAYIDKPLYRYRYEHISHYMTEYAERLQMIYSNLQKAREKSFDDLGLFSSDFLSRKYYEEAIYSLVCTCKYGIFIKQHSKEDQEKMFFQFIDQPCFERVLSNYREHTNIVTYFFRHSMVCLYYQLIVRKQVKLLYLIGRLRALLGR